MPTLRNQTIEASAIPDVADPSHAAHAHQQEKEQHRRKPRGIIPWCATSETAKPSAGREAKVDTADYVDREKERQRQERSDETTAKGVPPRSGEIVSGGRSSTDEPVPCLPYLEIVSRRRRIAKRLLGLRRRPDNSVEHAVDQTYRRE